MTADELQKAYEIFKQMQFDCKTDEQRYNSHFYEHMRSEADYFLRFSSWVKQSYPDVWEAWQAIEDIKNG